MITLITKNAGAHTFTTGPTHYNVQILFSFEHVKKHLFKSPDSKLAAINTFTGHGADKHRTSCCVL